MRKRRKSLAGGTDISRNLAGSDVPLVTERNVRFYYSISKCQSMYDKNVEELYHALLSGPGCRSLNKVRNSSMDMVGRTVPSS